VIDAAEIPNQVLLIEGTDDDTQALAQRIRAVGVQPILLPSLQEAERTLEERRTLARVVLIPTDLSLKRLKRDIRALRKTGPASGLIFVSVGRAPPRQERKRLRAAGLTLALWDPYDDAILRYQLNRAANGDRNEHNRSNPRAPCELRALISVANRAREVMVYSLSPGGAFLQTPRVSMSGAKIGIQLRLPGQEISTRGEVIFCNVPGNLQRPNLPLGMGVRFDDLDRQSQKAILAYVKLRLAELEV
jgi:hypothetical protein